MMLSIVIPAFREAERIGPTLSGVQRGAAALDEAVEILVVDDGSDDGTAEQALAAFRHSGVQAFRRSGVQAFRRSQGSDRSVPPEHRNTGTPEHPPLRVIRLERNQGKGAALARGLAEAHGEWIVMLDADLGETAAEFPHLLAPVRAGTADMTIALFGEGGRGRGGEGATGNVKGRLSDGAIGSPPLPLAPSPPPSARGGFGLALRVARRGVALLTGRVLDAPLSGQRAFRAAHLPLLMPLEPGFGLEVGLDIDALRAGLRVLEVPTTMAHAATGRDWTGFRHRGRQLLHILRALARRAPWVSGSPRTGGGVP